MKLIKADLTTDIVSSYNQSKTTIQGRVASKSIGGKTVLGPPLSKFIDMGTDTGAAPVGSIYASPNGRLFVFTAVAATSTLHLYDFNYTTGASTYVGRINFVLPNSATTTHTIRGLRVVNDAGNTGWKIYLATVGSVLINGGTFVLNNIDKADFVQVSPPTFGFATGNDQKAVYFSQNSAAIGVNNAETATAGMVYDSATNRLYTHNGIAATHQYYVRDTLATLTYASSSVTVSVATPGVVSHTAHGFNNNDPVTFIAGTLPTGLTVGTVYFVRNSAANTYELSATSGGASISTTGSPSSGAVVGRAFGTTSADFLFKTGNLPALAGTLLLTDSERKAIPVAAPLNGPTLNGNSCAFFATSSNFYLGLLSELTANTTTWPSLTTSNVLGTVNQITAPTPVLAGWSNTMDSGLYLTNTSKIVMKQVVNNLITAQVGELNNQYYEGYTLDTINLGFVTVINFANESGWLFILGGTTGQRGIGCFDLRSDSAYDFSYIVTKVMDTPNSQIQMLSTFEKLYDLTGNTKISYRTTGFNSISGGWVALTQGEDLSAISTGSQIQFKIAFNIQSEGSSTPAQVYELLLGMVANAETSDNWEYSYDNSSSASPTRVAFRLKKAYASAVPTLFFRTYDLTDTLLINHNTAANASNFEYSTNDGGSWQSLGTIPNTVGTLVRYNFTSPPGVKIRPGLKES